MSRAVRRTAALIGIVALIVGACGGATVTSAPTGGASGAPTTAPASEPASGEVVEIRWYCCLGGGDAPEQVEIQQKVAADFNASHPNIRLTFEAVPYDGARDALATQIASGSGPDIVGPVGIGGAEAFHGQWLDLQPLIDSTGYDMSQFPESTVSLYNVGGEGQLGIPFAVYPSALFYKKSLFEEAGLNEPPHEWGGSYTMPDGTEKPWDYDTVREVAMLLTVDKNGKDATQDGFDPEAIEQWGFEPQRDDIRQTGAYWKAGQLAGGDDGTTAQIPEAWAAAWKWFYDAMWTDHFSMTGPQFESPELNPSDYPFFSGNVAMSQNYLWSTYGVADAGDDWDLAATPSYQGQTTAAFNADTFRILKGTKHPDEAFEVLTYLLGDASSTLLTTYGGMPARPEEQDAFFTTLQEGFPNEVDWNVAKEGVNYADVPNFESYMPAYNKSLDLLITFGTKWQATPGLDLDAEIEDLRTQLQAIWDAEG
jgi:multiple sugar transport system substrate-binding protein